MKNQKTIVLFVAMLFASKFLLAVNPKTETVDDISSQMVEATHKVVVLTNEQKGKLKKKATEYAVKLQQARVMEDKEASYALMKVAKGEYQAAMDSLLTPEQKVLKDNNYKDKINKMTARYKAKKDNK